MGNSPSCFATRTSSFTDQASQSNSDFGNAKRTTSLPVGRTWASPRVDNNNSSWDGGTPKHDNRGLKGAPPPVTSNSKNQAAIRPTPYGEASPNTAAGSRQDGAVHQQPLNGDRGRVPFGSGFQRSSPGHSQNGPIEDSRRHDDLQENIRGHGSQHHPPPGRGYDSAAAPSPHRPPSTDGAAQRPEGLPARPNNGDMWIAFKRGPEVGRGQFGTLYFVTERETGQKFACKQIIKKNLTAIEDVEDVKKEILVMHVLPQHPNIIKLKAVFEDANAINIVMEFCEGGDLATRIAYGGPLCESDALIVFSQVLTSVAHMHQHRVMHRDLKPENFLFGVRNSLNTLKAIDFGLSLFISPGQVLSEVVGSPVYMAPELLQGRYSLSADMWSVGVILYVILVGMPPFHHRNDETLKAMILKKDPGFKEPQWKNISADCLNLVKRLLERDPSKRLSVQEALAHPWVARTTMSNYKSIPSGPRAGTVRSGDYENQLKPLDAGTRSLQRGLGRLQSAKH